MMQNRFGERNQIVSPIRARPGDSEPNSGAPVPRVNREREDMEREAGEVQFPLALPRPEGRRGDFLLHQGAALRAAELQGRIIVLAFPLPNRMITPRIPEHVPTLANHRLIR
jgi:hypothetical protein